MAVNVISRLKIKNGANEPIAEGPDISASCAVVANTAARDAILTNVKGSSYLVYRVDLSGFEYWNGSTWTAVGGSGSGSAGIPFNFDSSTTDADPGTGDFRLQHATPASATAIYIDDVDADGNNRRDLIASFDDMVGAIKGYLTLVDATDEDSWIVYSVGGYTSASGYGKLTGLTVVDVSDNFAAFSGEVLISFDTVGLPTSLNNQSVTNARCITYNEVDNGNSGAADTIDWTAGQTQKSTLTGNCTFTFTAPPGACGLSLKLIQDGTGNRTVTWPASVKWVGGAAPTLSTAAAAVDLLSFYYDGTDYHGSTGSAALPAGVLGDALCFNGTSWVSTSVFLSNKTISKSSADANAAILTLRKSRGTSGSPAAHNADDVLAELIAQGHDGSGYFNAGRLRWVAKAAGGTKKTTWLQRYHHDGTAERVVEESCVEEFSSSGDGDNTRFTIAIGNDEQVTVRYRVRGVGPSNKHVWREHYVTYRRVGSGAPALIAETYIIPLNNTDDTDWSIGHSISSNNLLLTDNGETSTAITWKWRVTIERD